MNIIPTPNIQLRSPGPDAEAAKIAYVAERVGLGDPVLVFVNTADAAELLAGRLCAEGISAAAYTSRQPDANAANRAAFQAGELDVLVATSSASRGISLTAAAIVIHYDLPPNGTYSAPELAQRTARVVRWGNQHPSVDVILYGEPGSRAAQLADGLRGVFSF